MTSWVQATFRVQDLEVSAEEEVGFQVVSGRFEIGQVIELLTQELAANQEFSAAVLQSLMPTIEMAVRVEQALQEPVDEGGD